jgi:hypothetical protein
MFSHPLLQFAVIGTHIASVVTRACTRHSGASAKWDVVVACSGAPAEYRFYKVCKSAGLVVLAGLKRRLPGLRLASARSSVARGQVTYNYAFERTGYRHRFAVSAAAQRGR